jgi:hypothetical protein
VWRLFWSHCESCILYIFRISKSSSARRWFSCDRTTFETTVYQTFVFNEFRIVPNAHRPRK